MSFYEKFIDAVGKESVIINEPMSKHCSFKTGGNAEYFLTPKTTEKFIDAIEVCKKNNIPYVIMGNGSNLLVSDKGIKGAVITTTECFSDVMVNGSSITAGAGASLSKVALAALENELEGFEFAAGIPGSFGGAVFMNAGAYGGEIKDVIIEAKVLTNELKVETITPESLELGYRTSSLEDKQLILLEGKVLLQKGNKENIKAIMSEFNQRRRDKQPLNFPSAGSTFKRPEGHFAGKLIEDAGLKGYTIGGAQVSEKHAGFVINKGNATTSDILAVINHCKKEVKEKFGVELHCEVRMLGEF